MSSRRCLLLTSLLAIALHFWGISGSILPAQDGLKFIATAKAFQHDLWIDVIRGSDRHPLYPGLIALAEPPIRGLIGPGPEAWRIAAQVVSAAAYLGILVVIHGLTRTLFDRAVANLAVFLFVLLPIPAEVGRDTLADMLGLLCFSGSLSLAARALKTGSTRLWLVSGLVVGVGYLARPDAALAVLSPMMLLSATIVRRCIERARSESIDLQREFGRLARYGGAACLIIGTYALIKGEVTEKLALRSTVALGPSSRTTLVRSAPHPLPAWIDREGLDFSAKEETGRVRFAGKPIRASGRLIHEWIEGLGWIFAPFAFWGFVSSGRREGSAAGRRLILLQMLLMAAAVIPAASRLGYLSGRHALGLVVLSMPFAAAAMHGWASGVPARRGFSTRTGRALAFAGLSGLFALGVTVQLKGMHPSRAGHRAAGEWLLAHANAGDAVLDTRGWAAFVRGGPSYDYWHVRQALTDARLRYVVVESEELEASTPRAATLRHILERSGKRMVEFSDVDEGDSAGSVLVYRFAAPIRSEEGDR
ncbi:MAG: glycosyltransferase family 39 protein [Isosphaeraceae bacterium]|nr:glycosyltransferase family 39 protein [Isosphaeraceae bacterium]